MVRVVRFAWDDEENEIGPLDRRDRFDDFDDPLLDPYLPDMTGNHNRTDQSGAGKDKKESRNQPNRESEQRHLADADWLNENPSLNTGTTG